MQADTAGCLQTDTIPWGSRRLDRTPSDLDS